MGFILLLSLDVYIRFYSLFKVKNIVKSYNSDKGKNYLLFIYLFI